MPDKPIKAVIFGCEGHVLSKLEKTFFEIHNPLGFILFERNCQTPQQVKDLIQSLKDTVTHDKVFILIDQEGGRVQRLNPPYWRKIPSAEVFGELAKLNPGHAKKAVYINHRLISEELNELGININCAPVLDLREIGDIEDDVIGDRSFGTDPTIITTLARAACEGLLDGGIMPILKHIPGHRCDGLDSHKELPVVDRDLQIMRNTDFVAFKNISDMPIAMTAHIKYTAIDKRDCASFSRLVISEIRSGTAFSGVLISDDISMNALEGEFDERTKKCLAAGCDVVLHCNGNMKEMRKVASAATELNELTKSRMNRVFSCFRHPKEFNKQEYLKKLDDLISDQIQQLKAS